MSQQEATRLFIAYQSLHIQYQERANARRWETGKPGRVYSDDVARLAKSKADYYEGMIE